MSTPLETCEKRDRKGLYAKARKGLIKGFTGIDDPYEEPTNPEVSLDTTNMSVYEAVETVIKHLQKESYL
jgi:sulfate adenylyltransferase